MMEIKETPSVSPIDKLILEIFCVFSCVTDESISNSQRRRLLRCVVFPTMPDDTFTPNLSFCTQHFAPFPVRWKNRGMQFLAAAMQKLQQLNFLGIFQILKHQAMLPQKYLQTRPILPTKMLLNVI